MMHTLREHRSHSDDRKKTQTDLKKSATDIIPTFLYYLSSLSQSDVDHTCGMYVSHGLYFIQLL